jgi:hypothetical protein
VRVDARKPEIDDVDDGRALAAFFQQRQRGVRCAHHRHHVDRQARGPAGLVVAHAETGGVVHQHVDAAERGAGVGDITRHRLRIGQIARRRVRGVSVRGQLGARAFERLAAARTDRHAGAGCGERLRDRAADAATAATDDDAAVVEGE